VRIVDAKNSGHLELQIQPVADIVQCGLSSRNTLRHSPLDDRTDMESRKLLILLILMVWLAKLDSNSRTHLINAK
jgi:hypothetical protein